MRLQTRRCSLDAAAEEMAAKLKAQPALLKKVLERTEVKFEDLDTDGDGSVSREEFGRWVGRRYKSLGEADASAAATDSSDAPAPTSQQLRRLGLQVGIPFVGFGFLDNAIMICAGDSIDAAFGATLGLSALAAAGLGNLVSDVVGIQASTAIEQQTSRMGLPSPGLSAAQLRSRGARLASVIASMVGISVGCVLGLCPLLVMEEAQTKALRQTFDAIDTDKSGVIEYQELEHAVHALGLEFDRRSLERIFSEIDADRSRAIDFAEFKLLLQRWRGFHQPGDFKR